MSYEKDKLDSYVTSGSLSTALAPYATSASVSAAITAAVGAIDLAPYMTSNSISAAVATDTLTVRGTASVSATLSAAAVTVAGRPVGAVLLGYQTVQNVTEFSFSGSWSDFAMLELRATYTLGQAATASFHIFTDGGTTPILAVLSTDNPGATPLSLEARVLGGNAINAKYVEGIWRYGNTASSSMWSATANAGFINCIRVLQSATMSSGMAYLIGYRTS
jgi:hypothetical protein